MALTRALLLAVLFGLVACFAAFAQDAADPAVVSPAVSSPDVQDAPAFSEQLSDEAVTRAFRRMKRASGTQWDLRTDLPEPPDPPPAWLQAIGEFFVTLFSALAPVFQVAFWLGVAALVLLLLYAVAMSVRDVVLNRPDADDATGHPAEYVPSAGAVRVLLEDADQLAAEGRFAEAIHLILFRSIQDIERARPDAVRLSLTSREIARSPALGGRTRDVFAAIARLVERSHFAGRPVGSEDYAAARALYLDLLQPAPQEPSAPGAPAPA